MSRLARCRRSSRATTYDVCTRKRQPRCNRHIRVIRKAQSHHTAWVGSRTGMRSIRPRVTRIAEDARHCQARACTDNLLYRCIRVSHCRRHMDARRDGRSSSCQMIACWRYAWQRCQVSERWALTLTDHFQSPLFSFFGVFFSFLSHRRFYLVLPFFHFHFAPPFAAHMNGAFFSPLLSFWVLFKYAVSTASVLYDFFFSLVPFLWPSV